MELKDTIKMMDNKDYKERFKAEYYQLKIRYEKLTNIVDNWNKLSFTPSCPKEVYFRQLSGMKIYLQVLEERSIYENINLENGKE